MEDESSLLLLLLSSSSSSKDIFLTSEERYQVWCIKVAERPELLAVYDDTNNDNNDNNDPQQAQAQRQNDEDDDDGEDDDEDDDDGDDENVETTTPALTDGCDIPGWRQHGYSFAAGGCHSDMVEAVLGVGTGCTLLRRERQLPVVVPAAGVEIGKPRHRQQGSKWQKLQNILFQQPLPPIKADDDDVCLLKRLEPRSYDYQTDIEPMYNGTRTWKDPPPPFERDNVPASIAGCTTNHNNKNENWPCLRTMTWNSLLERYGGSSDSDDVEWRFSDTHGAGMTLHTYHKYCSSLEGRTDDAPLAIYDSQFHRSESTAALASEFTVPVCFQYDLFAALPEEEEEVDGTAVGLRPPFQWILMGPERSGTGLHVDPIGTHAWVTLLEGCKRWVLFPPDTPSDVIGYSKSRQVPSVVWFDQWWCGGKIQHNAAAHNPRPIHYVEYLQYPGDTIYVPAGWPHLVLNLQPSVAITQNYATEYPTFSQFWKAVQTQGTDSQQQRLLASLQQTRPDLVLPSSWKDDTGSNDTVSTEEGGSSEED